MADIVKIVVYVPEDHADVVRRAMGEAGAGKIGKYSHCSFSISGVGRFIPKAGAHPAYGKVGQLCEVVEERIETVCDRDMVAGVVEAIKKVHPYDEAPIDIWPLELV
jgi:hypothetical protein